MKEENQMPEATSHESSNNPSDTAVENKNPDTTESAPISPEDATPEVTTESSTTPSAKPEVRDTEVYTEPVVATEPTTESESVQSDSEKVSTKSASRSFSPTQLILGAVVIVVFLIGLVYLLEERGVLNTSFFAGMEQSRMERTIVATVDGEDITQYDLQVSIQQQAAAAAAQGIDPADEVVSENIRTQALTLLINTELLKSEAFSRGLSVSDTEAMNRYDALVAEVGGEEVLRERMEEFGVTEEILQRDIRDELLIQQLIDQIFENNEITVSDEEVREVYETAGGEEAGLPPFDEVEPQIIDQVTITKEQELVNEFVETLRADANIVIAEEA